MMLTTAILKTTVKPRLSVKVQTLAALAAIVGVVVVSLGQVLVPEFLVWFFSGHFFH